MGSPCLYPFFNILPYVETEPSPSISDRARLISLATLVISPARPFVFSLFDPSYDSRYYIYRLLNISSSILPRALDYPTTGGMISCFQRNPPHDSEYHARVCAMFCSHHVALAQEYWPWGYLTPIAAAITSGPER